MPVDLMGDQRFRLLADILYGPLHGTGEAGNKPSLSIPLLWIFPMQHTANCFKLIWLVRTEYTTYTSLSSLISDVDGKAYRCGTRHDMCKH